MITEPKIVSQTHYIGDLKIHFAGENWGKGLQDTKVTIEGNLLCWIGWDDKDNFINELSAVVSKYRI